MKTIFDEGYAEEKNKCDDVAVVRCIEYVITNVRDDTQHIDLIYEIMNTRRTKTEDEIMQEIYIFLDEESASND